MFLRNTWPAFWRRCTGRFKGCTWPLPFLDVSHVVPVDLTAAVAPLILIVQRYLTDSCNLVKSVLCRRSVLSLVSIYTTINMILSRHPMQGYAPCET